MRPTFVPHLVNGVFGAPALYVDCKFEKRGLLFDLGDLKALASKKMLRVSDIFVSHMHMDHFMGSSPTSPTRPTTSQRGKHRRAR
jgi:ribonuclease Z